MFQDYIVTHDGRHHADELFAIALLEKFYFRRKVPIVRTRLNLHTYTSNQYVFVVDVGTVFDPVTRNFDHHMASFTETWDDGTPKSSCGLIFDYLVGTGDIRDIDLANMEKLIKSIDAADNGRELFIISNIISNITSFDDALAYARQTLDAVVSESAFRSRQHKEIITLLKDMDMSNEYLVMPTGFGLSTAISEYLCENTKIKLVITPRNNGEFSIQSVMNDVSAPFSTRCPAPMKWRGLYDEQLINTSGIPDMIFCHKNGFLTVCKGSLEHAITVSNYIIKNAGTLYAPVGSIMY